jgi:hypothetical protein
MNCKLTWRLWHDCFVFLFHGYMRRHDVRLDLNFIPPMPYCYVCNTFQGHNQQRPQPSEEAERDSKS